MCGGGLAQPILLCSALSRSFLFCALFSASITELSERFEFGSVKNRGIRSAVVVWVGGEWKSTMQVQKTNVGGWVCGGGEYIAGQFVLLFKGMFGSLLWCRVQYQIDERANAVDDLVQ